MATQNDIGFKSLAACGAISAFVAVDIQSDGTIAACGLGTKGVGITQEDASDGSYCNVKLWTAPGTFMIQASGTAITAGTTYSIATGGYAGIVTTGAAAIVKALETGVASNGITLEYALA